MSPRGPLLAALLLCGAASGARAETGRTAASFLRRALGARAAAMGGAFVAVRNSADSLQYNPGALSTIGRRTVTTTYLSGFGGTSHGFLGYAHPLGRVTLGAGALYYNAGPIDLNLSDGTRSRVTAEENTAFTMAAAVQALKGLHLGGAVRWARLELAETAHATTVQEDMGMLWQLPGRLAPLSLGAAYQYLGPDIAFEEVGDPPPKTLRYGLALRLPSVDPVRVDPSVDLKALDMTLAADVAHTLHEDPSPRCGIELGLTPSYMNRVALRFGWVFQRSAESFTFGMGLHHQDLGLDYGFGSGKDLGNLQQLSLSYVF